MSDYLNILKKELKYQQQELKEILKNKNKKLIEYNKKLKHTINQKLYENRLKNEMKHYNRIIKIKQKRIKEIQYKVKNE